MNYTFIFNNCIVQYLKKYPFKMGKGYNSCIVIILTFVPSVRL